MLPQGVLGFQYEAEGSRADLTSLAGLPLYLDLIVASGVAGAIRGHLRVAGSQGWLDVQLVLAVVFLNFRVATAWRTWSGWRVTEGLRRC